MHRIAKSIYGKECLRVLFILTIALLVGPSVRSQNQKLRTYTPEDLVRLEEIGETALSPDGELLAYVVKRAKSAGPVDIIPDLNNNDRADIWIVSLKTRTKSNITNGLAARAGYFAPRWSPDGQRLAMLSTTDRFVKMMIWTRNTQKLEPLSSDRVEPIALENFQEPYIWISNRELVYVCDNQPIQFTRDVMTETWAKLRDGSESTANVLESGVPVDLEKRQHKQLKIIDVVSGQQRALATATGFGQILLSPNRERLAFLRQVGVWQPDSTVQQITTLNPAMYQLLITDLTNASKTREFAGIVAPVQGSLLWSPDSVQLAIIGYRENARRSQIIFECQAGNSTCDAVSDQFPDLDPYKLNRFVRPPMIWINTGELLLNARQDSQFDPRKRTPEWWAIDAKGKHRRLIPEGQALPTQILAEVGTSRLVAVIDGKLCEIDSDGRLVRKFVQGLKGSVSSILWTDTQQNVTNLRTRRVSTVIPVENVLIFETRENNKSELWSLNLKNEVVENVPLPAPNAFVIARDARAATVALFAYDDTGTYMWTTVPGKQSFGTLVAMNTFMQGIELPKLIKFQYRSSDGVQLTGWLMLPTKYEKGHRYPMVTWVYPSTVFGDRQPSSQFLQLNPFDLRLLATRGYAVLYPSMPLRPFGQAEDVYSELPKGVLPAIDKVVEMGIADPDRVGLMGHSFGGYATYGLLTQTKRFRAAVASAGLTNMSSLFGVFYMGQRYQSNGHESLKQMWAVETIGMGGPPWSDLARYFRNSPINYVDRVETPLLIIHGDFDKIVQLEQGEEFFTSLYRQNKRAKFVRYFGEEHLVSGSAANITNVWDQIFSWFDEFLTPVRTSTNESQRK